MRIRLASKTLLRFGFTFLCASTLLTSGCSSSTAAGSSTPAQQLNLSTSSISFPGTLAGQSATAQSATVTNAGSSAVSLESITLTGTNGIDFSETTTCAAPGTLAAGASCTISSTFAPTSAGSYSASIVITSNATGSPQTIALSGAGTVPSVTHTLYTFPESDNSVTPLYALVTGAQKSIDMTMYELEDTIFTGDLVAACGRGVKVRVILSSSESSSNKSAYTQLNTQTGTAGTNCSAVMSNTAFENTHQKSMILDGTQVAIMSLNLQTQYYSTTRDFAVVENDAADIAAIEATFNMDYAAGTPYNGTQGASDFSYQPAAGTDLIWSPTTAKADMLALITNATKTLVLENEEMDSSANYIVSALEAACARGVSVKIAMVDESEYESNFKALEAAGCGVHVYPDTTTGFYIHAKAVVADLGLSTQNAYMGSINYSNASMTENRELGMYITDQDIVQSLNTTMTADYNGGTAF